MAHSKIVLEKDGLIKTAPVGFSWTTLFLGGWPALLRGHVMLGIVQIILQVLTMGITPIFFAFIYNKMYVNYRLEEGYRFQSASGKSKEEIERDLGMNIPACTA